MLIKQKALFLSVFIIVLMTVINASGSTWRLGEQQDWQQVGDDQQGQYLLAVSEIKRSISDGDVKKLGVQLDSFRKDFPGIAGADFDDFVKAEEFFAEAKFNKAVRAYEKFLQDHPSSVFYESSLERLYQISTAFLNGQKIRFLKIFKIRGYEEGARLIDKIADVSGDRPIAKRALVFLAENYEKRGKFFDAYQTWSDISYRWPTGDLQKQALMGMARSLYLEYKGPRYDVSGLISSKGFYQNYKLRYPEDAAKQDIDKIIEQIDEQIAYKQYTIAQYYEKTSSSQAANLYYQQVVDDWGNTRTSVLAEEKVRSGN